MNLKELLFFNAASGGGGSPDIPFAYMLSGFTNGSGSGAQKHIAISTGQGAYAAGYGTIETDYPIRNATSDGKTYYPILTKGASKLSFTVPDDIKVTVFFCDSKTKADAFDAAAWIAGDASAYDANVPNGNREVDVPEGADAFTFSVYYKSHTVTDEIMNGITVTGS